MHSENNSIKKRVAILQSSYIPWKGYFDQINSVDEFVLYDCAQYTKRDWRNRNKIKTSRGLVWLTIPVEVKGKFNQTIEDTLVADQSWAESHFKTLVHNYSSTRYFALYKAELEELYEKAASMKQLSQINFLFLQKICGWLRIQTPLRWSNEFKLQDGKTERLLGICRDLNATLYLSGPAAKDYLQEDLFSNHGIEVAWADYSNYPVYSQAHPPFEHGVSVLDLLFNEGPNAVNFMKSYTRVSEV
ncbi:MAG: WbqC family protein [Candidatus Obscuribacterales bacterium]|jgi:hypothetical protein|nr:WbqC family protein [Candidatus Obscuribacterales bacterium]